MRRAAAGNGSGGAAQMIGAIGEVAAEEFVGAFAAERHGGFCFAQLREEPDG